MSFITVEYFLYGTTLDQVEDPIFSSREMNIK